MEFRDEVNSYATKMVNWGFKLSCGLDNLSLKAAVPAVERIGAHSVFLILFLFSEMKGVFVFCFVPETKGKSMDRMQRLFRAPHASSEVSKS